MHDKKDKPSVELEDLLQLKRYEKPSEELWYGFEEKIRHKAMQQMVQRKRKRDKFFAFLKWSIPYAPVAAVLIFTLSVISPDDLTSETNGVNEVAEVLTVELGIESSETIEVSADIESDFVLDAIAVKVEKENLDYSKDFSTEVYTLVASENDYTEYVSGLNEANLTSLKSYASAF